MFVESAVLCRHERLGQQRGHFVKADDDTVLSRHPVDHGAVPIEDQGRLGGIVLGHIPDAGNVKLVQGQQQYPQKHGQDNTDPEHEADDMAFVQRLLTLCG